MNLRRYLNINSIKMELSVDPTPPDDKDPDSLSNIRRVQRDILHELVELFCASGQVSSKHKLFMDLLNREKRASTAMDFGVAFPHVRTMQARSFIMVFARFTQGITYGEHVDEPTQLFFGMVAPPYDDKQYLQVYRTLAPLIMDKKWRKQLLKAKDPHEILSFFKAAGR